MKNKMLWKLTSCFAVVLLLFTVVLGTVFVTMFRRHTMAINRFAMEEKAVSIAMTLASFETGINTGKGTGKAQGGMNGYGAYLRFLNELAMAEVWIVDKDLSLLMPGHEQTSYYGDLPDNAEQIVNRVFQGEITYGEEFSGFLDTPTLTVGAPIQTSDGITGAVLLHSSASGVNEAVLQGLSALLFGAAIALLFSGIAAFWLSYRFTSPLRRMKAAALRLAEGDFASHTGVTQSDEFGQLAQTIDYLSEQLSQAEQNRAALDQLKQDFIANVSHELRTPVAVLRGSIEVLRDGTIHQPSEISEYYDQMLSESHHLERLVNDLLDLSRLQDNKFQLDMVEVNLCDIIRDTSRAIRRTTKEKNLTLSAVCPESDYFTFGDYGRIRQLLLILLDNAIKFSPENDIITLLLNPTNTKNKGYLLSVKNHGKPIAANELPFIFDRFYKKHGNENISGTGLGLSIAKQIADRHGIQITVESNESETCFSLLFSEIHL